MLSAFSASACNTKVNSAGRPTRLEDLISEKAMARGKQDNYNIRNIMRLYDENGDGEHQY